MITHERLEEFFDYGPYAWPGGYPVYLVLEDGTYLCWECFKENYKEIDEAIDCPGTGWGPMGYKIIWEGEEFCAHCNKLLESAYGSPE